MSKDFYFVSSTTIIFVVNTTNTLIHRNDGNKIPAVGLGTWQSSEENDTVYKAIKTAIAAGYRHIDTAMMVSFHIPWELLF